MPRCFGASVLRCFGVPTLVSALAAAISRHINFHPSMTHFSFLSTHFLPFSSHIFHTTPPIHHSCLTTRSVHTESSLTSVIDSNLAEISRVVKKLFFYLLQRQRGDRLKQWLEATTAPCFAVRHNGQPRPSADCWRNLIPNRLF